MYTGTGRGKGICCSREVAGSCMRPNTKLAKVGRRPAENPNGLLTNRQHFRHTLNRWFNSRGCL